MRIRVLLPADMSIDLQACKNSRGNDQESEKAMQMVHKVPGRFVKSFRGKKGKSKWKPGNEGPPTMCLILWDTSILKSFFIN